MNTDKNIPIGNKPFNHLTSPQEQVPAHQSEETQAVSWRGIGFTVNQQQCAVAMDEITEVAPVPPTAPLPGTHSWVKGLANIRGRVVPIVDLGEFLEEGQVHHTPPRKVIILEREELSVGLMVDDIQGMVQFSQQEFSKELPDTLSDATALFSSGCYKKEVDYVVLNTNRLVAHSRFLKAAKELL